MIKVRWQTLIFLFRLLSQHFLVSILVCWFWFQGKEEEPGSDRVAVGKGGGAESYRKNKICHFGLEKASRTSFPV